jgi:hypothetical protein
MAFASKMLDPPPSKAAVSLHGISMPSTPAAVIPARLHESGFRLCDSNFFSLTRASDGNVYYTLCSHNIDTHARLYRYDPRTDKTQMVSSFGDAFDENDRTIPQGKSHSPYFEVAGKLYGATHYGFMNPKSSKEEPGVVPEGYKRYPGGHFFRFDLKTGVFEDLARAPENEGLITMAMDTRRQRMYALTWPSGLFLTYDIPTKKMHNLGPACRGGEAGSGESYMCLCRCFGIVPETGAVYFTLPNGDILHYDYDQESFRTLEKGNLRIDIFGQWDHAKPGHQGYNWRQVFWYDPWRKFVAVHGKSGWLYTFDPETEKVELLERICALELKKSGRFEPFRYGYLTLELGRDGETVYYLTGTYGLTAEDGRNVEETLHLVTYNLKTAVYRDHGVLRLGDGRYPKMTQSLLQHIDGRLYSVPWIERFAGADEPKRDQVDLISFPDPLAAK